MKTSGKVSLGRWGENWVRDQMLASGWRLWHQNYKSKGFEIDLLMQKGQTLAVVEVKTRRNHRDLGAVLSKKKCQALQMAAEHLWIHREEVRDFRIRIDLAVLRSESKGSWRVQYFPAVIPTYKSE